MNSMMKILAVFLGFVLLFGTGCAPQPVTTDSQMRQTIEDLRQIQQQQARQLEQLMQKFALLQPSGDLTSADSPRVAETEVPPTQAAVDETIFSAQSSAEIAVLTESSALYLQAFGALATGRISAAKQSFRAFIQKYPQHEFSGNARYWLAEALLAEQDDTQAEALLLQIVENPQEQQRAAAALARLIDVYQKRGATEQARATLQQLRQRYPVSAELQRFTQDSTLF